MKKIAAAFASLIALVFVSLLLIPVFFKDTIRQALDTELDKNLNARVLYDVDAFSLSLIREFPNFSLSIGNFGVVGTGPFEKDTLLAVKEFNLTIDLKSVLFGDNISIKNIAMVSPDIKVIVLEDGTANYDIVKASDEQPVQESTAEEESALNIAIDQWSLTDANIAYYDATLPFYVTLLGMDHTGKGDFAQDVFDMVTQTSVSRFSVGYDGDEYITDKKLTADVVMAMDLANWVFTFRENQIKLNDFAFGFDGSVIMPAADITMDITYSGQEINLKSLLSLIPGTYDDYLDGITAGGVVGFNGYVKGTYNEKDMPAVAASFTVENGNIRYAEYPIPMEKININASFEMPSADLRETTFSLKHYSMELDGEPVAASLYFKDLEDYYWDFSLNGNLDLEKITRIIPFEDMELKGKLQASMQTKGRMSDLEAEAYQKLETSGQLALQDFSYIGADLPQGFGIKSTRATFTPEEIILSEFKGNAGNTDLNMSGKISNYMAYALEEDGELAGNLIFQSSRVDLNEWMTSEESAENPEQSTDTAALEVIQIPENITFYLQSTIAELIYDDISLRNFNGALIVKDGTVRMDNVNFNLLDGTFKLNGLYAATDPKAPIYDFALTITDLSIPSAFKSFNTVRKLAPFAEKMDGKFSTNFSINGLLGDDMLPKYETITGAGLINIVRASLNDVKLLGAVSTVTKVKQEDESVSLKDVLLKAEIKDGSVFVKPFDVKLGGYTTTISGSNTIDGLLSYVMTMKNIPTGAAGETLNSALASFTGQSNLVTSAMDVNMGVGGNFLKPEVKLLAVVPAGSKESSSIKDAFVNESREKITEQKTLITQKANETTQQAKDSLATTLNKEKEAAKDAAATEVDKAKEKAQDAVKDILGKKKKGGK